jgi:hypothetical protein
MMCGSRQSMRGLLATSALALLLATAPVHLAPEFDAGVVSLEASSALARGGDGGKGGGNSGKGGGDSRGGSDRGGNSGRGGGDDHGGNSGRGGGDDRGGDDHGGRSGRGGGDDRGGDDHGGRSGRGGGDDRGGDDHGGRSGRGGGDDRGGDDHGGRSGHRGGRDHGVDHGRPAGRSDATKVEIEGDKIEVTFPDGTRQEIENGRFERKNAQGRTVVERPATRADFERLNALAAGTRGPVERSRGATKVEVEGDKVEVTFADGTRQEIENGRFEQKNAQGRTVVERPATRADFERLNALAAGTRGRVSPAPSPAGGATKVEISGRDIEVTHADGWREEIENGRYELKDPDNNTVVERPATSEDRSRLRGTLGF